MWLKPLADGVWQLDAFPAHSVNAYLVDDILFDCRTRWAAGRITRELRGRKVSMLALTHAHPDHWGAAPELSATLGIPVACHESDLGVVSGERLAGSHFAFQLGRLFWENGTCDNVVTLRDGDMVGDFRVVHTPGHSDGHVIYFRESDGLAIVGDLFNTMGMWTRRIRIEEPPANLSVDMTENRRSIMKLLELGPSMVLPGHGTPLVNMQLVADYMAQLPADRVMERAGSVAY